MNSHTTMAVLDRLNRAVYDVSESITEHRPERAGIQAKNLVALTREAREHNLIEGEGLVASDASGNPVYYLDGDNSVLCADCATQSIGALVRSFQPNVFGVKYRGEETLTCDDCSKEIA